MALPALGAQSAPPSNASRETAAIEAVLDDWHDAAAKADEPRYFAHFTPDGVYLGTDATERWTASEFRAWARPYFARGKAWTFRAKKRNVVVTGDTALFDELLDTQNMGTCRGSGALRRVKGTWKIALYDLSIPIPNDLAKEVTGRIAAHEGGMRSMVAPTPEPMTVTKPPKKDERLER
ncbi:MAG: nuclear transport factor 2 family protein [Acidobacteria bacterium]|nr:nuclear transport factor 2 family protein [Acidobacteriota bacterium]